MRNLLLFFIASLLFTSCDELDSATPKEIKTINGYKIVGYYEIDGTDSVKVGERTFYPNSEKVYLEFRIKDGKRHGECLSFFQNGTRQSLNTYKEGMLNGDYRVWHENGELQIEGQYENNKEVGEWVFYDKDGNVKKTQKFN
ncbi:MAG: toxin-antitoxin system YwqK family antitoxin [Bacteroidota bacterium]